MKKFRNRKVAKPAGLRNEKSCDAAPTDFSIQEVPRSLKEFMLLKESAKSSKNNKLKAKSNSTNPPIRDKSSKFKPLKVPIQETSSLLKIPSTSSESLSKIVGVPRRNNLKSKKKLKLMKLNEKRKNKKLLTKFENDQDANEIVKDDIKFGEVVHRPPQLSTLPRKVARSGFQNRPGRKDDLLLKSLLKRKHSK